MKEEVQHEGAMFQSIFSLKVALSLSFPLSLSLFLSHLHELIHSPPGLLRTRCAPGLGAAPGGLTDDTNDV